MTATTNEINNIFKAYLRNEILKILIIHFTLTTTIVYITFNNKNNHILNLKIMNILINKYFKKLFVSK